MKLRKKTNWRPRLETLEARRLLSTVWSDFNGDGRDDLAIGVPGEDSFAGAVHVLYGSSSGLTTGGSQFWSQDASGVLDTKEPGDRFGAALAGGDFNNDGRADLAIGVPGESIGGVGGAGIVQILLGSPLGLTAAGNQIFHQDSPRVREIGEAGDNFASALATGHLNGDAFADLVIGTPFEDVGSATHAGAISVFLGGPGGITPVGNQNFNLDTGNMAGVATDGAHFGAALTTGDFNGDGRDDVAIGAPDEDVDDAIGIAEDAGSLTVMYGAANGLTTTGNLFWTEATPGVNSTPSLFDQFGVALASGDFNADGRHDLAVGVPGETALINSAAGSIHVFYGSAAGITTTGEQFFHQLNAGGFLEPNEAFGSSLAAADFNGDGRDDIAIGTPEDGDVLLNNDDFGVVNIMYGSGGGITTSGAFQIKQEDLGTGESSEENDHFGATLGAGDFNGNGRADLVIGAPDEDIGITVLDTGRVWTLYGTTTGFTGGQSWGQDTSGILDVSEANDHFGGGLDANGGKSAPGGGTGRQDLAHLFTADFDSDTPINKLNKRRQLGGRR